tara:strand:- start:681 stop:6353 length:5673 start_codon:yes stop_codon:yes gene_type:complete
MAITTYSNSPYNDDFATANDNYLRILFQPGRSVQVRELNQLQSNLQDQIDKFGSHVFKDGDRVLNGYTTYDENIQSVPITFAGSVEPTTEQLNALKGLEIHKTGLTDLTAKVMGVEKFAGSSNTTFYRLYLKYFGTDVTSSTEAFVATDVLALDTNTTITLGTNTTIVQGGVIGTVATNAASLEDPGNYGGFFQDQGVFFIKGCFVHTDSQSEFYIKATANSKLTGDVVFNIVEEIVTYASDTSLLDNAAGTPNQNAPGADRYKLSLTLAFADVSSASTSVTASQQRIELLQIVEDNVTLPVRTEYSELGKAIATRSDETNGSYIVKPFKVDVREYFNDEAGNRGKYTDDEIYNTGGTPLISGVTNLAQAKSEGEKRYVIAVEPSTAYVQGYRVELEDKQEVVVEKGQDSSDIKTVTNYKQSLNFGGFILGTLSHTPATAADIIGSLDFDPAQTFTLREVEGTASIGTCRIAAITRNPTRPRMNSTIATAIGAGTVTATNTPEVYATHRIYVYDIQITTAGKTLKDATDIDIFPGAAYAEFRNTDGFSLNGEFMDKVYELPYDAVNEISTVKYTVSTRHEIANPPVGVSTITAPVGSFISTNPLDYTIFQQVNATDTAAGITVPTKIEITNSGANAVIYYEEADGTVTLSTYDMVIIAPVEVTRAVGVKTNTQVSAETITTNLGLGETITLANTDCYKINSITHSEIGSGSTDLTDQFLFDGGQTESHYGYGTVKYIGTQTVQSGTLTVDYQYFAGTDGPYTANSYTTNGTIRMPLSDVPKFQDSRLSNALDFRRSITSTTSNFDLVPGTTATFTVDYYNPRIDLVALNQLGDVSIIKGASSQEPKRPILPKDSLELFEIYKPGYVYELDDLDIATNNQRGYKMKDIGELESRVKNLEYYTSLNMLERETSEKQLFDASGERFKNGIFTDAFTGHGGGDTTNPAYKIGIDRDESSARPMYLSENTRWSYRDSGSDLQTGATTTLAGSPTWNTVSVPSGTVVHSGKRKNVVCLDFIEKSHIIQPFATEHLSVNPYDVATWSGSLEISPTSDEWKDVTHRPDIINNVEGNNSALLEQIAENPNILGTEWNEWQTSWTGSRWGRRNFRGSRRGRRGWLFGRRRRERQVRSGIQTSLKETFNNEVIDDVPVDTSFIPFIRSRKVYFNAQLLKPNTKFYVYFDDVDVTSYCAEASFEQFGGAVGSDGGTNVVRYDGQTSIAGANGNITTNASGEVSGWIVIPNNDTLRFRTGARQIRVTNSATNNKLLETSNAEASYFAQGLLETRQRTVLSTRQMSLERNRVSQARNVTRRRWRVWRDPIAQTFMIGNEPTGVFLSSIDLFVKQADPSIPVEMSIVTVENGIPTQNTIPHSRVIKKAADVTVTADAQTASNLMFDTPVYLQPGVEYAIVLISNSAQWRVWTSRVGGTNVVAAGQNAEKVTKNVNLGVLLKSQNASTWTPDQNADLKFTINRADFQEDTSRLAKFEGVCPGRGEVTYIDVSPTNNSGYNAGAPIVTITGGAGSGTTAKATVKPGGKIDTIVVTNNGTGHTTGSLPTVTIAAPSPITVLTSDVVGNYVRFQSCVLFDDGQEVTYNANGGTAAVTAGVYYVRNVSKLGYADGELYQLYTDAALTSAQAIATTGNNAQYFTPTGQATATAVVNAWRGSVFYNLIEEMVLPQASTGYELLLRGDDAGTAGANEAAIYEVVANDLLYAGERFSHDENSGVAATTYDNELELKATLLTTDSKISPIIDLDRLSLLSFDNIINESHELETNKESGESLARYISKKVDLENPADGINVYFDGLLPDDSTNIKVYIKMKDFTSADSWNNSIWREILPAEGKELQVSSGYEFKETEYSYQNDSVQFESFALKIVFTSSNKAFAPEIKNLRAIATV